MPNSQSVNHTTAQRLQALALVEYGIPAKTVAKICEMSHQTVYAMKKKARQRGYDPDVSRVLKEEYVIDAPRSGQPLKVARQVGTDGKEKSPADVWAESDSSPTTIPK